MKVRFPYRFAAAMLLSGCLFAPALAQDNAALVQKIDRLERSIVDLERLVYRGGAKSSGGSSSGAAVGGGRLVDAEVRLGQLEDHMRRLTGTVEQVENRIARLENRLEKLSKDLELRLGQIESQLGVGRPVASSTNDAAAVATPSAGAAQTAPPSTKVAAAPDVTLPEGSTERKYAFAMDLLLAQNYSEAEGAFKAFLAQHAVDRLAGHAQYWLGETYYVRNDYQTAAITYLEGYQKYPSSPKAPDMLLKLAVSLIALGQKEEACGTLRELRQRYPNATTAIRSNARRQGKNAGCR